MIRGIMFTIVPSLIAWALFIWLLYCNIHGG